MLGKYLNGYGDPTMTPTTAPVPPGWSDWHVGSNGYPEFNYILNLNGKVDVLRRPDRTLRSDRPPDNYGVDVLGSAARSFIKNRKGKPFALEVATFAPHAPYTPAPRNAYDFPGLTEPRDPSFNTHNEPADVAGAAPARALTAARSPRSTRPTASARRRSRPSTSCWPTSRRRSPRSTWQTTPTSCSAPTTATTWASTD